MSQDVVVFPPLPVRQMVWFDTSARLLVAFCIALHWPALMAQTGNTSAVWTDTSWPVRLESAEQNTFMLHLSNTVCQLQISRLQD